MKTNGIHLKAKEPIECQACHKMIEIGMSVIRHHVSYFPEKTIPVHGRCHGLIHKARSDYPDLKPNPAQTIRWYKKKGVQPWRDHVNAHDWYWLTWIDCVENGFMTEERIERISKAKLQRYWEECDRIRNLRKRLNIREDWLASDVLSN